MIYTINRYKINHYKLSLTGKGFIVTTYCCGYPTVKDFQDIIDIAKARGWIQ